MRIGALEAGGTKMVCAVGNERGEILARCRIETGESGETIRKMTEWFADQKPDALGIGSFGPLDLNSASETYGFITTTPKAGWAQCDLAGAFHRALHIPVGIDTDVNASVLGEVTYGQARGLQTVLYLTVGTGVGLGVYLNGRLHHGLLHPEGGHVLVGVSERDPAGSICPFHPDCLEGLASGPSIEKRWGKKASELQDREEVWELEAAYLARALADYILVLAPEKIILGGGVMKQRQLFPLIRREVARLLNGYLAVDALKHMETYIVPESLKGDQGILGCLQLGLSAWNEASDGGQYGRT